MALKSGEGGRGIQSEINVTPMVDIMLVLLIIFMVVTPFLRPGIAVPVPTNMTNPEVDPKIIRESSVVISIPNEVEYYLGKKRLGKEQLASEVQQMLEKIKNEQDRVVYIKSAAGVTYGSVVNVINEVRKVGVDKIGLVADKKKTQSTANAAGAVSLLIPRASIRQLGVA